MPAHGRSEYTYKELLDRVFNKITKDRPELQDKKRTRMKPPQVAPYGSRKTIFVNFVDICSTMHREPEHALGFLLAELGANLLILVLGSSPASRVCPPLVLCLHAPSQEGGPGRGRGVRLMRAIV